MWGLLTAYIVLTLWIIFLSYFHEETPKKFFPNHTLRSQRKRYFPSRSTQFVDSDSVKARRERILKAPLVPTEEGDVEEKPPKKGKSGGTSSGVTLSASAQTIHSTERNHKVDRFRGYAYQDCFAVNPVAPTEYDGVVPTVYRHPSSSPQSDSNHVVPANGNDATETGVRHDHFDRIIR
jgi:hypothetical protein